MYPLVSALWILLHVQVMVAVSVEESSVLSQIKVLALIPSSFKIADVKAALLYTSGISINTEV